MEKILQQYIDDHFDSMLSDIQELVRIPSVLDESSPTPGAPFGEPISRALRLALEKADAMGFRTGNIDGYAGYAEMGEGEQVAILAHLDVVPAVGEWIVPPYSAEIVDGKLYGRGAVDDKGPGIACLYGMKAVLDSGLPISRRCRLIWGTDEETLARGIHYYLEREEAPAYGFSPDAEFPIIHAEKGTIRFLYRIPAADGSILRIQAGTRLNIVPDYASALVRSVSRAAFDAAVQTLPNTKVRFQATEQDGSLLLEAFGVASHACYPGEGVNAIQGMLLLLKALFPAADSPLKRSIHALAAHLGSETDGTSMGLACRDEISGALTFNTAIIDVDENGGVCKFDIRYPVTRDGEALLAQLKAVEAALGATFELIQHKPPLYVEKDRPFIGMLQQAYEECTGDEPRCISIGGGTYCRYVKNTVSFGPVFPGQKELAHQCNEFLALEDLRRIAKIYAQAIYNLIR